MVFRSLSDAQQDIAARSRTASICGSVFLASVLAVLAVTVLGVRHGLVFRREPGFSSAVPDKHDNEKKDDEHASEHMTQNPVKDRQSAECPQSVPYRHKSKEKREQIAGQSLSAPDKEAEHCKRCPEKYVKILNKRHKRLLSVSVEIDKT